MIEIFIANPTSPFPYAFQITTTDGIIARSVGDFVSIEDALKGISILTGVMEDAFHGQEHIEVYDGEKMIHIPRKLHDDETPYNGTQGRSYLETILDGILESPYVGDEPEQD